MTSPDPAEILHREEGRHLFGRDAHLYEAGRPQYPETVYEALRTRCGLTAGHRVLEVGPGTGLVSRRLLEAGASLVLVEPDPGMAAYLRSAFHDAPVEVLESILEGATVPDEAFDLAVAATSFHWVEQEIGLQALHRALKPGAWVALWWTLYRDPQASDEFSRAVESILGPGTRGAFDEPGRPPFQVDIDHRIRDMQSWGNFDQVEAEIIETTSVLKAGEARALYASMATVLRRGPAQQAAVLDAIQTLVEVDFGGTVERRFLTALYTGQRPLRVDP